MLPAAARASVPARPVFDAAASPVDEAGRLAQLLEGPTGRRDERRILALVGEAATGQLGVGPVLYELSRHGARLPDKVVRDVVDGRSADASVAALWSALRLQGSPPAARDEAVKLLRAQAMALASRENPAVRAYLLAHLARTETPLTAFGAQLSRLESSRRDGGGLAKALMDKALAGSLHGPLAHALAVVTGTYDPSTKDEAARVLASPAVRGRSGAWASLGDVTVLVNGTFNLGPSAAFLFRAAQHTRGAVIVAGSNTSGPDGHRLRPLTEVEGVPVPPELRGKLWAIGNLAPESLTWPQASDVLVEQLEDLSQQFGALRAGAPGLKNKTLRSAETTVVGFSAGAPAVVAARARLEAAGVKDAIDRVVTLSGALGGSPFSDAVNAPADLTDPDQHTAAERFAPGMGRLLQALDPEGGRATFESTDPDSMAAWRRELGLEARHVDLAYAASAKGGGDKVEPLFALNHALLARVDGVGEDNDGMVPAHPEGLAREVVHDATPKTHLMVWRDPATLDVVLRALP
ncbi:MAG: hypothetical protein K1X89_03720 [Myxococcaceae bacterium]|nr:hypothetical protein [Myxococcaceae bacterium]